MILFYLTGEDTVRGYDKAPREKTGARGGMLRECKIFITPGREPPRASVFFAFLLQHPARNNGGKTKRGGGGPARRVQRGKRKINALVRP